MTTRIDRLLVDQGLFDSRARAQAAIQAGRVRVDGKLVQRASQAVSHEAAIEARAAFDWVGRGALKLLAALELWPLSLEGLVVLDVGASTGGFTEVCLARGAARVFAVDVGRGQLHPRLRADPRVVDLSATDARSLDATIIPESPDLIVTDVSFISLTKALPVALSLARPGAQLLALVKPQFEAGPQHVGKGGQVKDASVQAKCVASVSEFVMSSGWDVRATAESPVLGGDGAVEYLLFAQKG